MSRIPRLYAPEVELEPGRKGELNAAESHHASSVLRLKTDTTAIVFNASGCQARVRLTDIKRKSVKFIIEEMLPVTTESRLKPVLCLAAIKADRLEWALQKATELGVDEIFPVLCERSVLELSKSNRAEKKHDRWLSILLSAVKQSGRVRIPQLHPVTSFQQFINSTEFFALKLICCETQNATPISERLKLGLSADQINPAVLIGPEGGFAGKEIDMAITAGWEPVALGRRTLRAETAAIAALTLLMAAGGEL